MQHYLPSAYGPIDRCQILSRQGIRDDMRKARRGDWRAVEHGFEDSKP